MFELLNCFLLNDEQNNSKNTLIIKFENTKYSNKLNFNDISNSDIIFLYYEGLVQCQNYFETI